MRFFRRQDDFFIDWCRVCRCHISVHSGWWKRCPPYNAGSALTQPGDGK